MASEHLHVDEASLLRSANATKQGCFVYEKGAHQIHKRDEAGMLRLRERRSPNPQVCKKLFVVIAKVATMGEEEKDAQKNDRRDAYEEKNPCGPRGQG